ncbi:MAG: hypothetical protein HFG82_10515 [Dorea sp.]|nr:hypothetical protein [Dorea sp.]
MQRNPRNENIVFLILRNNDILKGSRAAWTDVWKINSKENNNGKYAIEENTIGSCGKSIMVQLED